MMAVNKKVALLTEKKSQIDKMAFLAKIKKSLITITKNSLSVLLWIIAGIAVFVAIMGMSVFAFYLNGKKRKKIVSDLSTSKLRRNRPY